MPESGHRNEGSRHEHNGLRTVAPHGARSRIRTADRLSGRLVVVAIPAEGTLTLDGNVVPRSETLQAGLAVAYGNHILAWYDRTGVQRWRERFFLLPFQTKAIPVVQTRRDTP